MLYHVWRLKNYAERRTNEAREEKEKKERGEERREVVKLGTAGFSLESVERS